MKNTIVIDLDGTLCNTTHRDHLIQESWDAFHAELHNDTVYEETSTLIRLFSFAGYEIILLTGRMEKFRKATEEWLVDHGIYDYVDHLVMRGNDDYRRAFEIKCEFLETIKDNVLIMLDDNDKVVEHARNLGIRVWQVDNGGC